MKFLQFKVPWKLHSLFAKFLGLSLIVYHLFAKISGLSYIIDPNVLWFQTLDREDGIYIF